MRPHGAAAILRMVPLSYTVVTIPGAWQTVARRQHDRRLFAAATVCWLLGSACGPSSHELEVINNWDRGVVLYVVAERTGVPDQPTHLGSIPAGATQRFTIHIAGGSDRVHLRYAYYSTGVLQSVVPSRKKD